MMDDPFEIFKRETSYGWEDLWFALIIIVIGVIVFTISIAAGTYFGEQLLK